MSQHAKNILKFISFISFVTLLGFLMAFKQSPKTRNFRYDTVALQSKTITRSIQVSGIIESENLITIRSNVNGTLQHKEIREGAFVKKGQILATIYNPKIMDEVLLNENNLQLAQLNLNDAKRQLENGKKLYKLKSITTEAYRQLKMMAQKSKYELQRAKKTYEYAQTDQKELVIHAPFKGKIIQIIENSGSNIVSGTKLFMMANMDKLTAKMLIDEGDSSLVYKGQKIQLESDRNKDIHILSQISSISQMVDNLEMKGTLSIKCPYIIRNQNDVALGSSVHGTIILKIKPDIPTLPLNAVWQTDGIKWVYLYSNNQIYKQIIQTGIFDNNFIEILSGIKTNDSVVLLKNYKELLVFYKDIELL